MSLKLDCRDIRDLWPMMGIIFAFICFIILLPLSVMYLSDLFLNPLSFVSPIERPLYSVVVIKSNFGQAAGFIIDAKKGYILTANHVVDNSKEQEFAAQFGVQLESLDPNALVANFFVQQDVNYPIKIVYQDPNNDMALLQIDVGDVNVPLIALPFDYDNLVLGQKFTVYGHPHKENFVFSFGHLVSYIRTEQVYWVPSEYEILIVVGFIGPGYSGGPVLDSQNEVLGFVSGGNELTDYIVPVKSILESLKAHNIVLSR